MFKLIMKGHTPKAMIEPFDTSPMTKLCYLTGDNAFLIQSLLSEYLKFVEIAIVLVLDMRTMNKLFPWFWHSWKANYTTDWGRTWTLLVASLHKSSLLMKHSLSFSWMQLRVGNIKKCRLVLPFKCSCPFHYCVLDSSVFVSTIRTSLEPWSLVTWWFFYF